MNNLKNLAGNDVSIFLFRFVLTGNGINFVLNKSIAADMYQDLDEKLKPLSHACCETLLRYKHLSVSNTIMDGNILDTGEFEVTSNSPVSRIFPSIMVLLTLRCLYRKSVSQQAWESGFSFSSKS